MKTHATGKNKEKKKKNYIFIIFGELVVNSNTKKKCRLDMSPIGEESFYRWHSLQEGHNYDS